MRLHRFFGRCEVLEEEVRGLVDSLEEYLLPKVFVKFVRVLIKVVRVM
jgi:hypothetical protein